jgi:hypothetical protein
VLRVALGEAAELLGEAVSAAAVVSEFGKVSVWPWPSQLA